MNKKGVSWLYGELPELINNNIITKETADNLQNYYGHPDPDSRKQVILTIFGVLGAVFVGLGIILMIGYNWENLSRTARTILSILPLILGQILCLFVILKKPGSKVWQEGSSIFLMAVIGASISLVSQTYHISGDFDNFLLTWMLLSIPLVYVMRANLVALFYLIGITSWSATGYGNENTLFLPLFVLVIPEVVRAIREDAYSNRSLFLSWAVCICLTINIFISLEHSIRGLWIIAYSGYFASLYLIGQRWFSKSVSFFAKPFQVTGMLGVLILSAILTYSDFWSNIIYEPIYSEYYLNKPTNGIDYLIGFGLPALSIYLLVYPFRNKNSYDILIGSITILSVICYAITNFNDDGKYIFLNLVIFNLYLLVIGIVTIVSGAKKQAIGKTNAGMIIVSLLIMLRFFDIDMSFLIRGMVFILIGIAFFVSNYMLVKKPKEVNNEK